MACVCFSPEASPVSGHKRVGGLCERQVLLTKLRLPQSSWATRTAPRWLVAGHVHLGGLGQPVDTQCGQSPSRGGRRFHPRAFAGLGGLPGLPSSRVLSGPGSPAASSGTMAQAGPVRLLKAKQGPFVLCASGRRVPWPLSRAAQGPASLLVCGVAASARFLLCFRLVPGWWCTDAGPLPARLQRRPPGPSHLVAAE